MNSMSKQWLKPKMTIQIQCYPKALIDRTYRTNLFNSFVGAPPPRPSNFQMWTFFPRYICDDRCDKCLGTASLYALITVSGGIKKLIWINILSFLAAFMVYCEPVLIALVNRTLFTAYRSCLCWGSSERALNLTSCHRICCFEDISCKFIVKT